MLRYVGELCGDTQQDEIVSNVVTYVFLFCFFQRAVDALLRLPQSEARDALVRLTHLVITRKK